MNATSNHVFAAVGAALCAMAASADAAEMQATTAHCQSLPALQQRIVEKADQGMDALRQFVWRTKIIYGIDIFDVRQSLDAWRAQALCARQVTEVALPKQP